MDKKEQFIEKFSKIYIHEKLDESTFTSVIKIITKYLGESTRYGMSNTYDSFTGIYDYIVIFSNKGGGYNWSLDNNDQHCKKIFYQDILDFDKEDTYDQLPEKWFIRFKNEEQFYKLHSYYKNIKSFGSHSFTGPNRCYTSDNKYLSGIPNDYTEITLDQFKKYVLKEDVSDTVYKVALKDGGNGIYDSRKGDIFYSKDGGNRGCYKSPVRDDEQYGISNSNYFKQFSTLKEAEEFSKELVSGDKAPEYWYIAIDYMDEAIKEWFNKKANYSFTFGLSYYGNFSNILAIENKGYGGVNPLDIVGAVEISSSDFKKYFLKDKPIVETPKELTEAEEFIKSLTEDDVIYCEIVGDTFIDRFVRCDLSDGVFYSECFLNITDETFEDEQYEEDVTISKISNFRKATSDEIKWLEACEAKGEFVTKEEALTEEIESLKVGCYYKVTEDSFWIIGKVTVGNNGDNFGSCLRGNATTINSDKEFINNSPWCYKDTNRTYKELSKDSDEVKWLDYCIKLGKYVSKTEVLSKITKSPIEEEQPKRWKVRNTVTYKKPEDCKGGKYAYSGEYPKNPVQTIKRYICWNDEYDCWKIIVTHNHYDYSMLECEFLEWDYDKHPQSDLLPMPKVNRYSEPDKEEEIKIKLIPVEYI